MTHARRLRFALALSLSLLPTMAAAQSIVDKQVRLPLAFEPNVGQVNDAKVKFISRTPRLTWFFTGNEAVLAAAGEATRIRLVGAHEAARAEGEQLLAGKANYYRGKSEADWHTNVPQFGRATFKNVYDGIDLVYYGTQDGRLEYDFVVAPGANPADIALELDTARAIHTEKDGSISIAGPDGRMAVVFHAPVLYQQIADKRQPVNGSYNKDGKVLRFAVGRYDRKHALVIDPVVSTAFSTFFGGTNNDVATAIHVDSSGIYIAGATSSTDLPTTNAAQSALAGDRDHFITKISADGQSLIYSTYFGGAAAERMSANRRISLSTLPVPHTSVEQPNQKTFR